MRRAGRIRPIWESVRVRRGGKVIGTWALVAGLVVVAASLAACGSAPDSPDPTVAAFVAAWNRGDWPAMSRYVSDPGPGFVSSGPAITSGLHSSGVTHSAGAAARKGNTATVPLVSQYVSPGLPTWQVHSTLSLTKHSGRWLVDWSPAVIEPHLQPGGHLELTRAWAARAPILGAGGTPLTEQGPALVVGVEGSRIKDPAAVSAALTAAGATAAQVSAAFAAAAAHPTYFEPVFTLPQATFQQLGGQNSALYRVSGTLFQPTGMRAAITPGLAAHLVGTVGPVTAEQLTRLGPAYDSSSIVGQSGLEAAYQSQLAGKPGDTISAVNADGKSRITVATFPPYLGRRFKPASIPLSSGRPRRRSPASPAMARWSRCGLRPARYSPT